jgi:myosin-5
MEVAPLVFIRGGGRIVLLFGVMFKTNTSFTCGPTCVCITDLIEVMGKSTNALMCAIGINTLDEYEGTRSGQTVSSKFSTQLRDLVQELDATGLHFVRCIKPNIQLLPDRFESSLVLTQLRCCGVLEVARVSRAGFPTRYRHADFVRR